MKNIKKSTWVKVGIILLLVCMYLFIPPVNRTIRRVIFIFSTMDVEAIKRYILSFGIWAPIISFLLMIFQSVVAPLPAFLITFANAAIFGWVKGAMLSWFSAMAGATICFFIARFYGRTTVEKLTSKFALNNIDIFFDKYGKHAVLIARLLPFISFDIVSYVSGLTSMSFWSFFLATGLGQLPATIVYSYVGGMLVGGTKMFVFGLLILFSLSIMIFLFKQIWTEREKKQKKSR
ncbi:TVP38/TMEM64 family protein [Clostridium formicaceticum]|uniref:TVP38/TMEM64 family membrane protein n=1 Tax=Clostridium formicaceticum TaxID=1497 RepID=A0AAC9RQH2_9CLOT|nr:TVP38/TMEM64 family protein [Clostridium formicaceticum]AOY77833.1 hypothetical protein BJL90_19390 [Clostridium formicaceticum]ARE88445.1 TVP38/TMEM64 family inner membrane protein YdjZ [Clostridium formicaceticum]